MSIDFRAEIKRLIRKSKKTVPQISRETKMSSQTIYNYLQGRTEITTGNLEKILNYLGWRIK